MDDHLIGVAAELRKFGARPDQILRTAVTALGESINALELWGETQPQFHHIERDRRKMHDAHASLKRLVSEKTTNA